VLVIERLWSTAELERAANRHVIANRLAGEVRLDEQELQQAAATAAQSGDPAWISRGRKSRLIREMTEELSAPSLVATEREMRSLQSCSCVRAGGDVLLTMTLGLLLWRRLSNGLNASRCALLDAEVGCNA